MPTTAIIDLLQKLVLLTNERDPYSLELMLAKTIADITVPVSVDLYRLDAKQELFSVINTDKGALGTDISEPLKNHLLQCFEHHQAIKFETQGSPILLFPLKNNKNYTTAAISVMPARDEPQIELTIQSLIQVYQNYIGLINENERDTLTGLLNRKTFEIKINKVFASLLSQHARKGDNLNQKSFLAIFDIDSFKRVNDEYGHLIGDEVLLLFSQIMTRTFREKDMLFRFGGEEFVVIFECPSSKDMERVINRFREQIAAYNFPQIGKVTVSAGYTELNLHDTASTLIDRADAALYYAKNHGRNCVHNYEQLVADGHLQQKEMDNDIELF